INLENLIIKDTNINSIIFIKNLSPVIFESSINPWFVPNKIPGYELFSGTKKFDFSEIREVKIECVEELSEEAIRKEIKLKALFATEDYLKQIITNLNKDIKDIIIEVDILDLKCGITFKRWNVEDIELGNLDAFISDFKQNKV
ncbi:MAG: hypothetical protein IPP15_00005, partial [Saprospiraceae bacterium]|nr:hypothetical protein [Candidatus Opimibacter skivensis]